MRYRSQVASAIGFLVALVGCSSDEVASSTGGTGGAAGMGGVAGIGGSAGIAGSAGSAGAAGAAGEAGTAGAAGDAGEGGGGPWPEGCDDCHGGDDNPAPPVDLDGNTDTTAPGVGAHRAHLGAGAGHVGVSCSECHVVPTVATWDPTQPSHLNGVNDLQWGSLAQSGTYDEGDNTCANTYCHGATLGPDAPGTTSNRTPSWVVVDGSQAACGKACHTLPPGGSHSPSPACGACHGTVVASITNGDPPSVEWADPSLHINGNVEVEGMGCTACHGDPVSGDAAPPVGTGGETETTEPAVGAHQIHLAASSWRRTGQCADCHVIPGSSSHANGTIDFDWGGPSAMDGASPEYSAGTNVCSNVYCHGATLGPDADGQTSIRAPTWTTVDGSQGACGTACHTLPPGGSHPNLTTCHSCHGDTMSVYDEANPSDSTWNDPGLHINGSVDF